MGKTKDEEVKINKKTAASYMKLDLLDRYGVEYPIEKVITLDNDGKIWAYVGIVQAEDGTFYIRIDPENKEQIDTRYLNQMSQKLQEYSLDRVLSCWEDATCATDMVFGYYTPDNQWGEDASLKEFLSKETPIIHMDVTITDPSFDIEKECQKIADFIGENSDDDLHAIYKFDYLDNNSNKIGTFSYTDYRGNDKPTIEEIKKSYE